MDADCGGVVVNYFKQDLHLLIAIGKELDVDCMDVGANLTPLVISHVSTKTPVNSKVEAARGECAHLLGK